MTNFNNFGAFGGYNANGYGTPVMGGTNPYSGQAAFDTAYANAVISGIPAVQEEPKEKPEDIAKILEGINPNALKSIKKEIKKFKLGLGFESDDDEKKKKKSNKKADEKATDADENKDVDKVELDIEKNDRSLVPIHTVIGYLKSYELEKLAAGVFSQIFEDWAGCRVHSVNLPDNKSLVCMELQFMLKPNDAAKGKIKSVCPASEELDVDVKNSGNEATERLIKSFKSQRAMSQQKADIKLNKATRQVLTPFVSKNVYIVGPDGKPTPDWSKLETANASVGAYNGGNNITVGQQILTVKIDPVIFAAKMLTLLDEADTDKYCYSMKYAAPIIPQVQNYNFWDVMRFGDTQPFLIEFRQTNVREHANVMKLIGYGRFAPFSNGPMYNAGNMI